MTIAYDLKSSPVGDLFLAEEEGETIAVLFRKTKGVGSQLSWLRRTYPEADVARGVCPETQARLESYFAGMTTTHPFPSRVRGTEFEIAVWKQISKIPFGRTKTYGEIAKALGRPRGSQAVGRATGSNPVSILVPCHRVLGAGGSLTGYGGGTKKKIWLLRHEGVLMAL